MGTVTYDFLTESILFDDSLIKNRFGGSTDKET